MVRRETLPTVGERAAIWDLVIAKYGRVPADYDPLGLARASERHTGAEIEAAWVEALHRAFAGDRTHRSGHSSPVRLVPLAVTMAEPIEGSVTGPRAGRVGLPSPTSPEEEGGWRWSGSEGVPPPVWQILVRSRTEPPIRN
ncbi:MAG: hypothetical protein R3F31_25255 [Verrucomicrobiales bacterium]